MHVRPKDAERNILGQLTIVRAYYFKKLFEKVYGIIPNFIYICLKLNSKKNKSKVKHGNLIHFFTINFLSFNLKMINLPKSVVEQYISRILCRVIC